MPLLEISVNEGTLHIFSKRNLAQIVLIHLDSWNNPIIVSIFGFKDTKLYVFIDKYYS